MKRTIAIAIVLMMCLSYLVACNGNGEMLQPRVAPAESSESEPESGRKSAPEPTPAPEPKSKSKPKPEPTNDVSLTGFYTLIRYDVEGIDFMEFAEDSGESTLFIYIEFRNDGSAFYFFMDEGEDVAYKVSGNQVTLTFDVDDTDNELEGIIEGDTITFKKDGFVMVYERNPEFTPDGAQPPGF